MKQRRPPIPQPKRHFATVSERQDALIRTCAAKLQTALALHKQGRLNQAKTLYKEILQIQPQHFDALQLLAMIAAQQKRSAVAVELFDQALKINPDHAASLNNRGNALLDLKRPEQALDSYDKALAIEPGDADALLNRGNALRELERPEQALVSYDRALVIKPSYAEALNNRGGALFDLKRPEQALDSYDCALALKPDFAEALNNRGSALFDLKRPERALNSYDRALVLEPDFADALYNRGNALLDLKRLEQALDSFGRALAIESDYAEALNSRGKVLFDLKRPEQALDSHDRALALKPDFAEALNNRGNALFDLKRPELALDSYDRAIALKPDFAEALNNRGTALLDLKRPEQASDSFGRALVVEPDYIDAHWSEGLCRLLLGDFAFGWQKYEWRWKKEPLTSFLRNFEKPLWLGQEELKNKTILLHCEQGLGDTIQFCRYASRVAELGAKVILEVQPSLKPLLKNLAGVATVLAYGETLPDFDYHCPILSLPLAFKIDMSTIANLSYLQCDQDKIEAWRPRLSKNGKKKVGLVWSGSKEHKNDHNRSIAFDTFKGVVNDQADYYCLQKELRPEDKAVLEHTRNVEFFGDELKDFSDTAALVELMDLIVTVDTSVAHLAGAMGKEVWVLLPFNPDWRWLLDRTDSPWYQSAKLFRQPGIGDWESVVSDINAALSRFFET